MLNHLAAYAAITVVMLLLDIAWLGFIAKSFYRDGIGHLMADQPHLLAAGCFYVIYPLGVLLFAVAPPSWAGASAAAADRSWAQAALVGALFGFFAYATYDLSNLATLKGWPLRVALVDMAWGAALTAAAAAAGRWAWLRVG